MYVGWTTMGNNYSMCLVGLNKLPLAGSGAALGRLKDDICHSFIHSSYNVASNFLRPSLRHMMINLG